MIDPRQEKIEQFLEKAKQLKEDAKKLRDVIGAVVERPVNVINVKLDEVEMWANKAMAIVTDRKDAYDEKEDEDDESVQ